MTWSRNINFKLETRDFLEVLNIKIGMSDLWNIVTSLIPSLGWGTGSGSDTLYQVRLELLNQSLCNTILSPTGRLFFPEINICAGDVENGGKGICDVSY